MKEKIKQFIKINGRYGLTSFLLPAGILFFVYLNLGIYWGSARSVLASDAFAQFSNFHASFNNVLHGKQSILYTWNASLGLNYFSLVAYYLGGIFTPIVFFFNNENIPNALYLITLLKVGSAGLTFWIFARNTYKIPRWGHVALAVPYALMSFAMAHSEIIMWLDTFVWLPLVILGIHRVMDENKPVLLYVSYLLLFLSNFYMGFMVGVFSFLYFWVRTATDFKHYRSRIWAYLRTSLLAGIGSFLIVLPMYLDLRENGEKLTQMTRLKTEDTGVWDIVFKNFIGSYDTTKYHSIPFIYIGLVPLVFMIFYFVSRAIPWKNKLLYAGLLAVLIASFYFEWLNLAWQGFHSPNMFLFRFSFLFSFLVIHLAGLGLEKLSHSEVDKLLGVFLVVAAIFGVAHGFAHTEYKFITTENVLLTFLFLTLYFAAIFSFEYLHFPIQRLMILLLLLMSAESVLNTNGMLSGILKDWNYASASLYQDPHDNIEDLVTIADKDEKEFYRLENLQDISANDNLNFGYSGINFFSSIRNRHSSSFLNEMGFKSAGTNLNIRYDNNTLLMDSLVGMTYNIDTGNPMKYGFTQKAQSQSYHLYKNANSLPLGILTNEKIYEFKTLPKDNLANQRNLFNQLAGETYQYFSFFVPNLIETQNTNERKNGDTTVTFTEKTANQSKILTYQVDVPANTQAYVSLFATNMSEIGSSDVSVTVNGETHKSQMDITGQYCNLGYYAKATTVKFSVNFYGSSSVTLIPPKVLRLDTAKFQAAVENIKARGVTLSTGKRSASGQVTATKEDNILYTTIPYDKGWKAYVDGKKVSIKPTQNAFVTLKLLAGKHQVKFVYLPQGFVIGALCFILSLTLFTASEWWRRKRKNKR
ncbi:MAG: YfhO family protein [Lactobacillales bacterium]|jgi:uncharacterized membrane protein YfhO|nr:YfhO family protein [Lactobacillales bacterium]